MDVPDWAFGYAALPLFSALSECHFFAIDFEMSGMPMGHAGLAPAPANKSRHHQTTVQDRYTELKQAAEKYRILQVGITVVTEDQARGVYELRPYNMYLSPLINDSLHIERDITFQAASTSFLLRQGLSLDAAFCYGIPYLSRTESIKAVAMERTKRDVTRIPDIKLRPEETDKIAFVKQTRAKIKEWRNTEPRPDHVVIEAEGHEYNPQAVLNALQKRLVHQLVRAEFPDCVTASKPGVVWVLAYEADRENAANLARWDAFENKMRTQVGMRWVWEAILGGSLAEIDARVFMQPGTWNHLGEITQHFALVQERLRSRPRPVLVGHNLLADLVFFIKCFIGPLPDRVDDFAKMVHRLFPVVIDTKYLITHHGQDPNRASALADADAEACSYEFPFIEVLPGYERYLFERPLHEAGYDSFMTARVLIKVATRLEALGFYGEEIRAAEERAKAEKKPAKRPGQKENASRFAHQGGYDLLDFDGAADGDDGDGSGKGASAGQADIAGTAPAPPAYDVAASSREPDAGLASEAFSGKAVVSFPGYPPRPQQQWYPGNPTASLPQPSQHSQQQWTLSQQQPAPEFHPQFGYQQQQWAPPQQQPPSGPHPEHAFQQPWTPSQQQPTLESSQPPSSQQQWGSSHQQPWTSSQHQPTSESYQPPGSQQQWGSSHQQRISELYPPPGLEQQWHAPQQQPAPGLYQPPGFQSNPPFSQPVPAFTSQQPETGHRRISSLVQQFDRAMIGVPRPSFSSTNPQSEDWHTPVTEPMNQGARQGGWNQTEATTAEPAQTGDDPQQSAGYGFGFGHREAQAQVPGMPFSEQQQPFAGPPPSVGHHAQAPAAPFAQTALQHDQSIAAHTHGHEQPSPWQHQVLAAPQSVAAPRPERPAQSWHQRITQFFDRSQLTGPEPQPVATGHTEPTMTLHAAQPWQERVPQLLGRGAGTQQPPMPTHEQHQPAGDFEQPAAPYHGSPPAQSFEQPGLASQNPQNSSQLLEAQLAPHEQPRPSYEQPSAPYEQPSGPYEQPSGPYEQFSSPHEQPHVAYEQQPFHAPFGHLAAPHAPEQPQPQPAIALPPHSRPASLGGSIPFAGGAHALAGARADPLAPPSPDFPPMLPPWHSDFWRVYGNRLRVNGTAEGLLLLDPHAPQPVPRAPGGGPAAAPAAATARRSGPPSAPRPQPAAARATASVEAAATAPAPKPKKKHRSGRSRGAGKK